MTLEEFRKIDSSMLPVGKLIPMIARSQTIYINNNLASLEINATQLHLMFEISHQNHINQEKISQRCNINKGSVARSMKKLEDKGLIKREIDENNRRQNKISLTEHGEKTLKKAIEILDNWEEKVFDSEYIEMDVLQKVLKKMAIKAIELNKKGEKNE